MMIVVIMAAIYIIVDAVRGVGVPRKTIEDRRDKEVCNTSDIHRKGCLQDLCASGGRPLGSWR